MDGFTQPHIVGKNATEPDLGQVTQEIEAIFLIGAKFGSHTLRQRSRRNTFEILNVFAKSIGLRRIDESLKTSLIQVCYLLETDFLRHRHKTVYTHIRHGFMRGLNRGGVQLNPARVGQLHKPSCSRLESL